MVSIRRLEWDERNLAHIAKHKVTPTEVEQVCTGEPLEYRQSYKDRIVVIGVTEGRAHSRHCSRTGSEWTGRFVLRLHRPPGGPKGAPIL